MFAVTLCILSILVHQNYADYTIHVRAVSYSNLDNLDADGDCCDVHVFCLLNTCDIYFMFCIRDMGTSALDTSTCWSSEHSVGELTTKSYTFPSNGDLYSGAQLSNPIAFDSTADSWPALLPSSFQLLIQITDADDFNDHDLIDLVTYDRTIMSADNTWSSDITGHSYYGIATFRAQFKVSCATDYYGNDCTKMCVPRDDSTGHYTCSDVGEIICLDGYTDPSTNCGTIETVTDVCSDQTPCTNGLCENIGSDYRCICAVGYTGKNCDTTLGSSSSSTSSTISTSSSTSSTISTSSSTSSTTGTSTLSPTSLIAADYVPIVAGVVVGAIVLVCLSILISCACFCYFKRNNDKEQAMESIRMQADVQENRHMSRNYLADQECPPYDDFEKR